MSRSAFAHRLYVVALSALVFSAFSPMAAFADHAPDHRIGLEKYCPVCVIAAREWEMGRDDITSTYDGITYYFPNREIQAKFDKMPAQFVPALGGDCIVCYAKMNKRVPGNIRHASLYKERLYLFPSDREKEMFDADPAAFAKADLAANGDCVVCRAKAGKNVPGSEEFTEIHNGLRFLFPSAAEQAEFRRQPEQYAKHGMMKKDTAAARRATPTSAVAAKASRNMITVAGRSGCAACEHGVTPLTSPDELGLAVNTKDGRVVVIEDAHRLYPDIYASRFEGRPLEVEGMIVKTEGRVSWLKPSALRVVN